MDKQTRILSFLKERVQDNCITLADMQEASRTYTCPLLEIEEVALNHSILPARFKRNGLNCTEQHKLLQSRIAIVGCGGLGGRVAELLAKIGIGHLTLTDPDVFSESNLNRQIFCTVDTLGCKKAEVLSRNLQKINPVLQTTVEVAFFSKQSVSSADIVIDGLDSMESRKKLAQLCGEQSIPMVHGAVREWYGQVGIDQSTNVLINTLYPHTAGSPKPPKVLAMTVALVAAIQAAETCKILLGHESPLAHGWLQADLLSNEYTNINLKE